VLEGQSEEINRRFVKASHSLGSTNKLFQISFYVKSDKVTIPSSLPLFCPSIMAHRKHVIP
jgi:hypothetical protein